MKVCLVQMNTQSNKVENIDQAGQILEEGIECTDPDLVVLPELFTYLGGSAAGVQESAEVLPGGPAYRFLQDTATKYGIYVHGGSLNEREGDRLYNTTLVFGPQGQELARYRKIHLFDIVAPDGKKFQESARYGRGNELVAYNVGQYIVGCSICYDLRFPELYIGLSKANADIIVVPSAFTFATGKDHWELLCRTRAVETQTYLLASNQVGTYVAEDGSERRSYGYSMIVDPWGRVLASAGTEPGFVSATLDLKYLATVRSSIPIQDHRLLA